MTMLLHVLGYVTIWDAAGLKSMQSAPSENYILAADVDSGTDALRYTGFTGILCGQHFVIDVEQSTVLFNQLGGLLLRVRVSVTARSAAAEMSVFLYGRGAVKESAFTYIIDTGAAISTAAVIAPVRGAPDLAVSNTRFSTEIVRNAAAASAFGYSHEAVTTSLVNVTVALHFYQLAQAGGLAPGAAQLQNLTVELSGVTANLAAGVATGTGVLNCTNVTISCVLDAVTSFYAVQTVITGGAVAFVTSNVEIGGVRECSSFKQISSIVSVADVRIVYNIRYIGSTGDPPAFVAGIANGSSICTVTRAIIQIDVQGAHALVLSGIYHVPCTGCNCTLSNLYIDIVGDVQSATELSAAGLQLNSNGSTLASAYVALQVKVSATDAKIGGLYVQQTSPLKVTHAHVNATIDTLDSAAVTAGGIHANYSGNTSYGSASRLYLLFYLKNSHATGEVVAAGAVGRQNKLELGTVVIYVDIQVSSAAPQLAGVCAYAIEGWCEFCHIFGVIRSLYAVQINDGAGGIAGAFYNIQNGTALYMTVVDVEITAAAALSCATLICEVQATTTTMMEVLSVATTLQCGRYGKSIAGDISACSDVYELEDAQKDIIPDAALMMSYDDIAALTISSDWSSVAGVWHPWLVYIPYSFNDYEILQVHYPAGNFSYYVVDTVQQFTVNGLPNLISPKIGVVSNPYGVCTGSPCATDCSGHGYETDLVCTCEPGFVGPVCEDVVCSISNSELISEVDYEFCMCKDGFSYVTELPSYSFVVQCLPYCTLPICYLNGECYVSGSDYACMYCASGITGSKCDTCSAPGKVLNSDFGCSTAYAAGNGVCWYTDDACVTPGCDYECRDCNPDYTLVDAKCRLECVLCNGTCWHNSLCDKADEFECETLYCTECDSSELELGSQCRSCVSGYHFHNWYCYEIQEVNGGKFFEYNAVLTLISCDPGYKESGNSCLRYCTQGACQYGYECYYSTHEVTTTWTCQSCDALDSLHDHAADPSCKTCISGYLSDKDGKCRPHCQTCTQGSCYYVDQGCVIGDCAIECMTCAPNYAITPALQCQRACTACNGVCWFVGQCDSGLPADCPNYKCSSCDSGFVMNKTDDKDYCVPECLECQFGECFYNSACSDTTDLATCEIICNSCANDTYLLEQNCLACASGFVFYRTACYQLLTGKGGKYIELSAGVFVTIECDSGLSLVDPAIGCQLQCVDQKSCRFGQDCLFASFEESDVWQCAACDMLHTPTPPDLTCSSCIDGYIPDRSYACKHRCDACVFGDCYFADDRCTTYPDCEYRCVTCFGDYEADADGHCQKKCSTCGGTCWFVDPACVDPATCQYECSACDSGYLLVEQRCVYKCTYCLFGDCWFLQPCDSGDPTLCPIKCERCASEQHVMDYCYSCVSGYEYVNQKCYVVQWGYGGKYFKDELDQVVMLECLPGYLLENGNICRLKCTEGGCAHGIGCYYDNYLPSASYSCASCQPNYAGNQCDACASGAVAFEGGCYGHCQDCNGNCITIDSKPICFSCNPGYSGSTCSICDVGYTRVGMECLYTCKNCNGDCYIRSGTTECKSCKLYYSGTDCNNCLDPYKMYKSICSEMLTIPNGINCYKNYLFTKCERCSNGFGGELCASCAPAMFYMDSACYPVIDNNYCANGKCIKCNATNVLVGTECLPRCAEEGCAGECGKKNNQVKCESCLPGYVMNAGACYYRVYNENGICYVVSGAVVCECNKEANGGDCSECAGVVVDGVCYSKLNTAHGDCYVHPTNESAVFCKSCSEEYLMPDCQRCSFGYAEDNSGECATCVSAFTQNSEGQCIAPCDSCFYGNCAYSGSTLVCNTCVADHGERECGVCVNNTLRYGSYCLSLNVWQGGVERALSDVAYYTCDAAKQSFNCSSCGPGCNFNGTCRDRSFAFPEYCYESYGNIYCDNTFECNVINMQYLYCVKCAEGTVAFGPWCYAPLRSRDAGKYHGECYYSQYLDEVICVYCDQGWAGDLCMTCAESYLTCIVNGEWGCCEEVAGANGKCYQSGGVVTCIACTEGYYLAEGRCLHQKKSQTLLVFWVCFACLMVLTVVILIAVYFTRSKYTYLILRRRALLVAKRVTTKVLFTVLAQVAALIIAMQDVYINQFHMQVAVNLVSSAPFFIVFTLFAFPKFGGFQIGHWGDTCLFVAGALLEAAFLLIHYYLIPNTFGFSETFYKLSTPPVALIMFVLAARMKYTGMQIFGFFIALGVPIILYVIQTITESLGMYYFSADSYGTIFGGFLCIIAIELVLSGQYYITDMVLGKYDEVSSVLRLTSAQFFVAAVFFMCSPQPCMDAMSDFGPFLFCFVTQMIINVLSVIIMSNLTVMEYQINVITAAVWAQLIEAAGSLNRAHNSLVNISALNFTITILEVISVVVGLVLFVVFSSVFLDHQNELRGTKIPVNMYGVTGFWHKVSRLRSSFLQRQCMKGDHIMSVSEFVIGAPELAHTEGIALTLEETTATPFSAPLVFGESDSLVASGGSVFKRFE